MVADRPLFVFVSRLVSQKGLDILLDVLPEFLANNEAQFVFLGDGKQSYKRRLGVLVKKFSGQLAVKLVADFDLPHQIYAGGDFLVLPSITEPFGLVVAEAKRYGVVPIVHKTGGLADQVVDKVDGFCFDEYGSLGLMKKLIEAKDCFGSSWQERVRRSLASGVKGEKEMCRDFLSVLYENRL